ncbi:MAG: EthD family reductase [Chloroflexota bacterium]|nr:EthD family reductase [Chloroflexota bacterium]
MIKMIAFVKRKAGLSREEFTRLWVEEHTKLSTILGMKGYRINIALEPQPGGDEPPYDGTAEIWWDDVATMQTALASPENVIAAADVARFAEVLQFVYTEEFLVI